MVTVSIISSPAHCEDGIQTVIGLCIYTAFLNPSGPFFGGGRGAKITLLFALFWQFPQSILVCSASQATSLFTCMTLLTLGNLKTR